MAVGGTNGWFQDGIGNKPWTDAGHGAADFYSSKSRLVFPFLFIQIALTGQFFHL